ncbi:hypothetical protein BD626DRAFT_590586 [Schizophyllum amplum]|uniref:Cytoplasmic protein n=1 Tax=Schizophyllum amplum TaxID=97359 RepID=A0A550CY02_9AGAR|nr:hypothetical protein BD626DRAFT_590586 [Auriculariopsis ampla]
MWEPLPLIVYGYAIHPLSPSRRDTRVSNKNRLSTVTEASSTEEGGNRDVVTLEVGDEVYAFEKYTPRGKEVDGVWYRGYVVCTTRRPPVAWSLSPDGASTSKVPLKNEETQQVFIGIFPASHIYIRDHLSDAEGRLNELATSANGHGAASVASRSSMGHAPSRSFGSTLGSPAESFVTWSKDKPSLASLRELPEDGALDTARPMRYNPASSMRSASPTESQMKPLPPRPSLRTGDDTVSGAFQPIVDEIASAMREWHTLMFHHLARRDYPLFHIVRGHIDALHLGRRQLLAQTLSAEETINMRQECVLRLVAGNRVQDLDIIVRHPTWGGLVTTDVEGEIEPRSWISAVRMYAMQQSLAYMDVSCDDCLLHQGAIAELSTGPQPTPAHSAFPEAHQRSFPAQRRRSVGLSTFSMPSSSSNMSTLSSNTPSASKFYHVLLDVRAFAATICAPRDTAELFFSLYNKNTEQFLTEDFGVVLDHLGQPTRTQNGAQEPTPRRIRTLFLDLAASDVHDSLYLVCKIVRHGPMKLATPPSTNGAHKRNDDERAPSALGMSANNMSTNTVGWSDSPISPTGHAHEALPQFRRPFGCAVLELTQLASMMTKVDASPLREFSMPVFVPANENLFSMLHLSILGNATKEFERSSRADSVGVSVKIFKGDSATIIRENISLLEDIPQTQRLGFPDAVFPGETRNELYVKLWSGEFSSSAHSHTLPSGNPSGKSRSSANRLSTFAGLTLSRGSTIGSMATAPPNIQVIIEVRDATGRTVDGALSRGAGEPPLTRFESVVFSRCNEPTFGELLKVRLNQENIELSHEEARPNWHLFFTLRNRSARGRSDSKNGRPVTANDTEERPFAFAFQPLYPDGRTFLEDGSHTLTLYRWDTLGADVYLSTKGRSPDGDLQPVRHPSTDLTPLRDTLTIRTSLCSTSLTQDPVLLSLLNWEQISDRTLLSTVLKKFMFVGENEIIKFLQPIFDALFGIMVASSNSEGDVDSLVFNAIVTVLRIVQDRRFTNFQPVLDLYIAKHFGFHLAAPHIIRAMSRLLSDPTSSETASALRAALKVWHYIFRLITRSRQIGKAKEGSLGGTTTAEILEQQFRRDLRGHLNEVNDLMTSSAPAVLGTQTIALQHFPSILPELAKIYPTVELVSIVTNFANTITAGRGQIVIWKLVMYLQIVSGFLFDTPQARALLVEALVAWIRPHFGKFDDFTQTMSGDSETVKDAARVNWLECTRLCVTIIAVMLDRLQQSLVDPEVVADRRRLKQEQENVENLLPLLPRLLESYRELNSPASRHVMERARILSGQKLAPAVAFPSSYPFSLLASLPESPRPGKSSAPHEVVFIPGLGEIAIVILNLILSTPSKMMLSFLDDSLGIEGPDRFVSLLTQFFVVASSILSYEAFPRSWLNANVLAHKVLVRMLEPITTIMQRSFIPSKDEQSTFRAELWRQCFGMLLQLLSSDQLIIEEFSPQKRRAVWRLAGDVRGEGAAVLLNLWQALGWAENTVGGSDTPVRYGGYQVHLNSLVGQVVNLCLSHHDSVRSNAAQMLYSMIVAEHHRSDNFDNIENEIVTRLDLLFMSDSKGDDISRAFFIGQLRNLFENSDVEDSLRERVSGFLDSVDLFLELLLNVRALPEGDEFGDDRVIATLRLMNFIRRIGRDEIYIKYVHQLVNMHLQAQNFVEAALTLKLHSDLHEWDLHTFVPPMEDLGLPQQSQFHRKETLCLLIMDYLGKGKAWERAIEICKELVFQHAEVTFNYARLSEILRHQANLYEHIVTHQRYYSDYYRVTFYGDFPTAIRGKSFIYRGYEWEKYAAFCERMANKHTGARVLKTMGDPPVDIRFGNDLYIQCSAVTPEPDRTLPLFNNPDIPAAVRTYYEHCDLNLFSSSRQVRRMTQEGTEETWLEKAYFTTEETFPTVLRRSEIIAVEVAELSPIDAALTEVEDKTKELAALHTKYAALAKTHQEASTNALSMALNGVVDAPAGTGIQAFKDMFLNADYRHRNPDRAESLAKLELAVDEQLRIIDACLKLHGALCPPEFIPFHTTLETFFRRNYSDDIQRLGLDSTPAAARREPSLDLRQGAYEQSLRPSTSTVSTMRAFVIPPLNLGRPLVSPISPVTSTFSPVGSGTSSQPADKQTPLQKHLAHLARHGIQGVSSGAGDVTTNAMFSNESLQTSFVNVASTVSHSAAQGAQNSGVSVIASTMGSRSFSSLKGKFSRLGSLNFGRRGASSTS